MAELLVRAKDNTHPDPKVDESHCYKRGDVVVVMEDGHQWGRLEGPPDFEVVSVPGPASQWQHLREEEKAPITWYVPRVLLKNRRLVLRSIREVVTHDKIMRRRKWSVDLDAPDKPLRRKVTRGA